MKLSLREKKAIFFRHLKSQGMYSQYKHNVTRPHRWRIQDDPYYNFGLSKETNFEVLFAKLRMQSWIMLAFDWATSKEGRTYWFEANRRYGRFLMNNSWIEQV